jgi:hypothetical protein
MVWSRKAVSLASFWVRGPKQIYYTDENTDIPLKLADAPR